MKNFFKIAELSVAEYIPLLLIAFTGAIFTIKTNFLQIRFLKKSIRTFFSKKENDGGISSFSAVCTSLASTIGTGNIVGVTTAVCLGGPGSVFWIITSAFFAMIIKFFEIYLSLKFRKFNNNFGPFAYIKQMNFYPGIFSFLFLFFCIFSSFCGGNITQINTVVYAISSRNNIRTIASVLVAVLVFLILLGGIKRISAFSSIMVPIMSIIYIALCVGIICVNRANLALTIKNIILGAFNPRAVTGGGVGSVFITLGIGVSRGIFSNEAGLGTAGFAHSEAGDNTFKEALCGIFEVFFDTVVICTLTGIAILCSSVEIPYGKISSSRLIIDVFSSVYGDISNVLIASMLSVFGITSIVGWGYYGIQSINQLKPSLKKLYIFAYSLCCVFGAQSAVSSAWRLAALFNGFMLLINISALIITPKNEIFKHLKKRGEGGKISKGDCNEAKNFTNFKATFKRRGFTHN